MRGILIFLCLFPAVLRAEPVQIRISPQDCYRLAVPGADYVLGVSADGRSVAPADLGMDSTLSATGNRVAPADINGGVPVTPPDLTTLTLPVFLDLKKDFGFWNSDLEFGFIPVARVEIKKNRIFVNGVLVSENGAEALKKACAEQIDSENLDKNQLTAVQ